MLSFIIVDDDSNYCKRTENIINKVVFDKDIDYEILFFDDLTNDLKNVIKLDNPKIYILDIELKKGKSGLDIGRYIRENDWQSDILFLTTHDKMFERVYRSIFKVFDFIEKFDNMDRRLYDDLNKIIINGVDKKKLSFSNSRVSLDVYFNDIAYIYHDTIDRKCVIVNCTGNKFYVNKSLNFIFKDLDSRFKMVHRSCIVNNDKVTCYNWGKGFFVLENGTKVELLSKKYRG